MITIDNVSQLDFEKNNLSRSTLYKFAKNVKYSPWAIFYYLERAAQRKLHIATKIIINIAVYDSKNLNTAFMYLDKISSISTPELKRFVQNTYSQLFELKNINVWGLISLFNLLKINIIDRNYGLESVFVYSFLEKNITSNDDKFNLYKLLGEIFLCKGDVIEAIYFFSRSVRINRDHVLVPSILMHLKKLASEIDFNIRSLDSSSDAHLTDNFSSNTTREAHFKLLPHKNMVATQLAPVDEAPIFVNNVILRYSSDYLVFANDQGIIYHKFSFGVIDFMERSMLTENLTTLNVDSISLLPGYGHDNYSHFIYDRLPLLSRLTDENSTILVEFEQKKYIEQLRKYFKNDFIYLQPKKNYLIKSISLIANHIHPANYFPKRYLDFYKDLSLRIIPTDKKLPSLFYIYRPLGRRGVLNEEEFHSYLIKYGFSIIRLENYSIDEQINIFMNAKFIIGVHGAGLTNIIFSKPGTNVIEIIPKSYFIDCFLVAASRLGLNYHRFYEDDTDIISSSGDLKFNDSFIDINLFDIFLRKILVNS